MKPRISVITLTVDDLDNSLRFYRDGLGLETPGIIGSEFENGAVVFIDLQDQLKLALWPRQSLANELEIDINPPSATEILIGHNVASKIEVDKIMEQAEKAGATIIKKPHQTFYGAYAGYFQDPDQHLWEVVYNPAWEIAPE